MSYTPEQLRTVVDYIYVDMDGVIADFEIKAIEHGLEPKIFKMRPGAYTHLPLYLGARSAITHLREMFGSDKIWFLTKPPRNAPYVYAEKAIWMWENFGDDGLHNLIVTMDKSHVGTERSFLLDDRPHKGGVENFRGHFVHFGAEEHAISHWPLAIKKVEQECVRRLEALL